MGFIFMNQFKISSNITIVLVYLVILAGGVVRCTGSGMGCPDWPKCFGLWIPPTSVDELPHNFVELYSNHGLLDVEFNVVKTWTEYINRLLGVLVGVSIFFTLLFSLRFYNSNKKVFIFSLSAFILVCFQGWLGAKVVSTNLKPYVITLHMFVAIIIVFLLLYANFYSSKVQQVIVKYRFLILMSLIIALSQVFWGSQIRQEVDLLLKQSFQRSDLVQNLSVSLNIHIVLAYLLLIINLFFGVINFKNGIKSVTIYVPLLILVIEYLVGVILYNFNIPDVVQPTHLLLGSIFIGFQFYYYLSCKSQA